MPTSHQDRFAARFLLSACFLLIALLGQSAWAGWFGFGSGIKMYEVTLKVRDVAGNPIPYASIWYAVERDAHPMGVLDSSDLWRIANRLRGESYEFVQGAVKPYPALGISPMSNKRGGSSLKFPERENTTGYEVSYVILKHGYLPAKVVTPIVTGGDDQTLTVTLQPDPASGPVPRYLEEFDRIRYENTSIDIRDSGQVSSVSSLIQQLNDLADEAIRAGDKESAAKMLFYISYFPSASPGRAQSVDFFSPQAIEARKKAAELNPDNAFIRISLFASEGRQYEGIYAARGNTSPERLQAFAEYVERKRVYLDKMGERAWPIDHASLINDYNKLGMWDKMNAEIARIKKMEPKLPTLQPRRQN